MKLIPFSTWGTDIESRVVLTGFFCSLSIECIQLFTRLGKFETDDIMNNVIRVVIGFGGCKVIDRIFSRDSNHKKVEETAK